MIPVLSHWESFYVIVGSSAGALTGLQFVVITLIADSPVSGSIRSVAAFGSPTIVHFCSALLISAIVSAPWPSLAGPATTMSILGFAGLLYGVVVIRRARTQDEYSPVLEDWIWHTILPMVSSPTLLLSSIPLYHSTDVSLFMIGAASLLLLFIGIHNSWDTVTYLAVSHPAVQERRRRARERERESPSKPD